MTKIVGPPGIYPVDVPVSEQTDKIGQKIGQIDFLGDELPEGYEPWQCPWCTAVCNFEAMGQCVKRHVRGDLRDMVVCPFDKDKPESNGGVFGFMVKR